MCATRWALSDAASSCKNDQLDSERLARLGRMDPKLLHPIRHRGATFPRGIVTNFDAQPGDVGGLLANTRGELVGLLAFAYTAPGSEKAPDGDGPETGFDPRPVRGKDRSIPEATPAEVMTPSSSP